MSNGLAGLKVQVAVGAAAADPGAGVEGDLRHAQVPG